MKAFSKKASIQVPAKKPNEVDIVHTLEMTEFVHTHAEELQVTFTPRKPKIYKYDPSNRTEGLTERSVTRATKIVEDIKPEVTVNIWAEEDIELGNTLITEALREMFSEGL